MVDVAQLVERMVVVHDVAGSSPVIHPKQTTRWHTQVVIRGLTANELVGCKGLARVRISLPPL
jgi:hypothetical protein